MLIENRKYDLPESFRKTVISTILEAEDSDILDYVKEHKEFRGGLKPISKMVSRFKNYLCEYFSAIKTINPEETEFLYEAGFGRQLVTVLSYRALEYGQEGFRSFFGDTKFLLALLLDDRDEIFTLGKIILEGSEPLEMTEEEASTFLKNSYFPFLAFLSPLFRQEDGEEMPPPEISQKEFKKIDRELTKKNREIETLRFQISKERETYQSKDNAAAKKDNNKSERILQLQQKVENLTTVLGEVKLEKIELEKTIDDRVILGVEERLRSVSSVWLQSALVVEEEAMSEGLVGDLLCRTQQAINKQVALDHNTGNRQALLGRLSSLREAYKEVDGALINAIILNPDLAKIASDLSTEIDRVEQLLGMNDQVELSGVTKGVLQRLSSCDCYEDIQLIQDFTNQLAGYGLTQHETRVINNAVYNKINLLVAIQDGSLESLSSNSMDRLNKGLLEKEPSLIFFDGHNIINSLPPFIESCQKSHALGRQHFIDCVSEFSQEHPHCEFRIVFDGPERCRDKISSQVTIEFSGGGGVNVEHRADNYILEEIAWVKNQENKKKIYLVTSDNGLGLESSDYGVEIISAFYMEHLLGLQNATT